MAVYLNEVRLLGNLGADAEARPIRSERGEWTLLKFRLCTDQEWHSVEYFARSEKAAKYLAEALRKGALVYVAGAIKTDTWTDKAGVRRQWKLIAADAVKVVPTARREEEVFEAGIPVEDNPDRPDDTTDADEAAPAPEAHDRHHEPAAAPAPARRNATLMDRFRNMGS